MKKMKHIISLLLTLTLVVANISTTAYASESKYSKDEAYGDAITYSITNYFQNADGSFSAEESVSYNGTDFDTIDITPEDREGFKTPDMQTVELHQNVEVKFYYYRYIYVEVNYYKVDNGVNNRYKTELETTKGIDGETVTVPLIDIEGYKKPVEQTVTLELGKTASVNYYYTALPKAVYSIFYTYYNPSSKTIEPFHIVNEEDYVGKQITPPIYTVQEIYNKYNGVINLECYTPPTEIKTLTIKEDGSSTINYYYEKVSGYCTVFHYIQNPDKSYILKSEDTEKVMGAIDSSVTPETNNYPGYESPATQTVTINADDTVRVSYYYDIDPNYTGTPENDEENDDENDEDKDSEEEEQTVLEVGEIFSYKKFDFIVTSSKNKEVSVDSIPNRKSISIPSVVKYEDVEYTVTGIGASSFAANKKVTTVVIPETVVTIGKNAFKDCKALTKVSFKGSGLKTIKANAFYGCKKLKSITFGSKVKTIGAKAFYKCSSLKKIVFKGKTKFESSTFKGIHKEASFKLPKAYIKYYQKLFKKVDDYVTVNIGNLQ